MNIPRYFYFARSAALIALAISASSQLAYAASEIVGAGASLPTSIYQAWSEKYLDVSGNRIIYQNIGSGGGKKQVQAKTVDFGTTDIPYVPADLEKTGLVQFPVLLSGVVPIVNLPGVGAGALRLSGEVLANIYLGRITNWRDAAITSLNPSVSIPNLSIAVIHRNDGAGTTGVFTNYLSKVSPTWKQKVGEGAAVYWPRGLGGKGDVGVEDFVKKLPGAIGYVEVPHARKKSLDIVQLQHSNGDFITPDDTALQAAAVGADWDGSKFGAALTNQSTKGAWPMSNATFVLLRKSADKPGQANEALKFFHWAYKNGTPAVKQNFYTPLPEPTIALVRDVWRQVKDPANGNSVFNP